MPQQASVANQSAKAADRPDVSIVIPVFNKLELTQVCIESIHTVAVDHSFEIIVVDNGSTDGSTAWLAEQENLGRLRCVQNPQNLGYGQGCNLGAAKARGRYLLILNNDMEVLPGWLEPLVTCLDLDPQVGIVGACLIFADQTVQHGGVAMVEKTTADSVTLGGMHLSYQKSMDLPGARKNLEMQAVTGACLMIRPDLFKQLGGFDEGYWNGNEDMDLCLKAGERGWKVVYMGDSLIYHYESQSGPERWRQAHKNVERFNRIWRGRLRPDYTMGGNDNASTPDNWIRPYVTPALQSSLPIRTDKAPCASVIVLTWNALGYTRQCAESLLAHTDERHELIFVDNGSRQDTLDYLADLERDHRQVKVIRNGCNLGFAAGNNVGLAAATGEYLCLLNSDTVVTTGWLDRLMRPLEADARLGIVGPVTNSITGAQKLPAVAYDENTLVGLTDFAATVATEKQGQTSPSLWVVGFCLVVRRELMLRIGGLDEEYGLGNFEDTDFCLRGMLAGYQLAVTQDCFIHHFGSRSFVANELDYGKMLDEKFEIFRAKWGLAADARETGDLGLERLVSRGFVAPTHFQPLPPSPHLTDSPVSLGQAAGWVEQGERDFQVGNLASARLIFEAALAWFPDYSRAANNLACVLWQTDTDGTNNEAARAILLEILAREPDNEDARWNLAEIKTGNQTETATALTN